MKKYTLITKNFGHLFPTLNLKTKNFGQTLKIRIFGQKFGQNKFWTKVSDVFYAFRTKLVMNKSHLNNCMRVSVRQLLLD